MPTKQVFVYGTLKRGERNHGYLDGTFVKIARTPPRYRLLEHPGRFPVLMLDYETGREIQGEIWEVSENTLRVLDYLEGINHKEPLYERRTIYIQDHNNTVYTYLCMECDTSRWRLTEYEGDNWSEHARDTQDTTSGVCPAG